MIAKMFWEISDVYDIKSYCRLLSLKMLRWQIIQQLFMANRAPASPMEIDDGNAKRDGKDETDHS
ncbi:hypothetical protein PVL29_006387 [Vitis rotundifolia]|uniref:Uncharacterized protein n=1 Tax=Vitis rotundifolia TaxID=103349 RepID=A0AA39E0V3_VITRO|nr:hypothetical protein PVL29_006387 [Vitis rotundifolia]